MATKELNYFTEFLNDKKEIDKNLAAAKLLAQSIRKIFKKYKIEYPGAPTLSVDNNDNATLQYNFKVYLEQMETGLQKIISAFETKK